MVTLFLDCLTRATLIAGGTAVVLWAMRIKSAAIRHAAWTAVVIAMLLLPVWSIAGLRLPLRILQPAPASAVATTDAPVDRAPMVLEAADAAAALSPEATPAGRIEALDVLVAVYLLVAGVLLARLATGTVLALRLRRGAVVRSGIATSDRCATPITIGWLKPVAVLPAAWPQWPEAQLRAVLTHEGEHVRRRDPLVQWLALLNRAVFWFHPVAWWLERRLSALAEEACDAAVLAAGYSAEDYSGYLLDLARSVAGQRHRVHIGMAMVGGGLTTRVRRMLEAEPAPRLSRARIIATIALCATSATIFATGSLTRRMAPPTALAPQLPRFDVASIKPCDPSGLGPNGQSGAPPPPPAPAPGLIGVSVSPGRVSYQCQTLEVLIEQAYFGRVSLGDIVGGPAWLKSDRYDVEAKAQGTPSETVLRGSMLQSLLEDRFKLRAHRETRDTPVYTLTTAGSGLKLSRLPAGTCDPEKEATPSGAADQPKCGIVNLGYSGPNITLDVHGMTVGGFAKTISNFAGLDHPVVDKTGLTGVFNFHLEYVRDSASLDPAAAPSISNAVREQLGLELAVVKSASEFLIVDHVERPTPNAFATPGGTLSPRASVQAPQTTTPQTFDVASIRPCDLSTVPAKAGSGPTHIDSSHHRLFLECITVESLVRLAYARNGRFVLNDQDTGREIRGGPDWIHSSRYTIEATTASDPDESTMSGTMLRALLESRFYLRTHSDVEQVSKYAVQVAKSGLKIKPIAAGDCTDDDADVPIGGKAGGKLPCGMVRSQHRGATRIWDLTGASLKELADVLETDREVVDQTGVTGRFMIHLEYAREDASAEERARDEAAGQPPVSIPAALEQQLGLQFVSIKGPHTYFVIDRIERPAPDLPFAAPAKASVPSSKEARR